MVCELCDVYEKEQFRVIHETPLSFVTISYEPLSPSHIMVLPKRHVAKPQELTGEESKDLLSLLEKLSEQLPPQFNMNGAMSFLNHGAHRTMSHLHFHFLVLPEGLRSIVAPYLKVPLRKILSVEELGQLSSNLKQKLNLQ